MTDEQPALFEVDDYLWRRKRCEVCGCALSLTFAYTYFVARQGWLKIGATDWKRRRINELSRPAWRIHILHPPEMDWESPLETLLIIEGHLEHQLHAWFRDHHVVGEWFLLNDETRAMIEEVRP